VVEQNTGQRSDIGSLGPSQSIEIVIPLNSTSGTYVLVVDPLNEAPESDETNNVYSYIAPTPTPPALCTPAQPPPAPTLPQVTPSPFSLEGLRYADLNQAAVMLTFADGHSTQVLPGIMGVFSPDGSQVLFERSGDLWLAEPMDNPGINVTNTADRNEQLPQWWASNPAKVIFNSVGSKEAQAENWNHEISGYLSLMNKDGSEYKVLSDVPSYTKPAPSPDGRTIAYDALGAPMLYEIGAGPRAFDFSQYGYQPEISNPLFTSPSFSPEGHWLTWWIAEASSEPQRHFSLVMFDLTAHTFRVVYSYSIRAGTQGWLETPVWSPVQPWIAFQTRSDQTAWDLWVVHRDGGIGQRFELGDHPVWHPDGHHLAFVQWPPYADSYLAASLVLVDIPSDNAQPVGLPAGSFPLAWIPINHP
jgi:Tol biopolymer transport system component